MLRDPATKSEWLESLRNNPHERAYWRRVGVEGWLLIVILGIVVGLSGCATKDAEPQVCFMHMLGRTQDGASVVAQHCMTPEAFKETQK